MNKLLLLVLPLVTFFTVAAHAQSSNNGTSSASKVMPSIGMTKAAAEDYYGKPFTQTAVDGGERWFYRLKFSEVYGRAFVPFYYDSPNVRWGSLDFDADGRVKGYHWQHMAAR